jgi:hypothetical protein
MLLAKPIIVTAYSANMDFTTPANTFLVKLKLVEFDHDYGPYRKGLVWAALILIMRHNLCAMPMRIEMCIETGRRARKKILQIVHPSVLGKQIRIA